MATLESTLNTQAEALESQRDELALELVGVHEAHNAATTLFEATVADGGIRLARLSEELEMARNSAAEALVDEHRAAGPLKVQSPP